MFEMSNSCEKLFFRLAGDNLSCRQAVSYTLAVRYLKRVSAHLKNLATSLVMPIHKLDYFDEKWKR
jgi:phosphate uptake regulator